MNSFISPQAKCEEWSEENRKRKLIFITSYDPLLFLAIAIFREQRKGILWHFFVFSKAIILKDKGME
jgi:hypothetical protein